jgi:hypothetical protein
MRQTKKRTTVFKDDITEVIVEVNHEVSTPILDELYHQWWVKNCEEDQIDRELEFVLGPNWKNERYDKDV